MVPAVVLLGYDVARGWIALDSAQTLLAVVIFALAFPIVGWVVLRRWPGNRVGWVYLAIGFWQALNLFSNQYSNLAFEVASGNLPFASELSWIAVWAWTPGFTLFCTVGVLLFPDGRLPSRRWWPVVALALVALGLVSVPWAVASWPYRGVVLEAAAASPHGNLPMSLVGPRLPQASDRETMRAATSRAGSTGLLLVRLPISPSRRRVARVAALLDQETILRS